MDPKHYSTDDFICDESFQRYARGERDEDVLRWEAFIANNPQKATDINTALKIIAVLSGNQGSLQQQRDNLRDSLRRFDDLKSALPGRHPVVRRKAYFLMYVSGIAASLLLLFGWMYYNRTTHKITSPRLSPSVFLSGAEPRRTIVLPDNSVVTLRSNSRLSLSEGFGKNSRELTLSGEGFFDVIHDERHPFIVHTADVNIEVLGTVFNVSAYPSDHHTETSLFRGRVAITAKDHPEQKVILSPSEKIVVGRNAESIPEPAKVISLAADPVDHKAKEIAWVRNRLKIEDEPLSSIAARLQQWYGISISFEDDDVKAYRYSGTFESETVLKALEALQLSYPFSFRVEKNNIIIGK